MLLREKNYCYIIKDGSTKLDFLTYYSHPGYPGCIINKYICEWASEMFNLLKALCGQ